MKNRLLSISIYINLILFVLIVAFSFTGYMKLFSIAGKYFSLSFYISIAAIPFFYVTYFFAYKNKFVNKTIILILNIFILLFFLSLAMAFFIYPNYNGLFNTSPIKVVLENSVKYIYDLLLIPYFVFCLSFANKKILKIIIIIFISAWILFGIFQIIAYYVNNPLLWKAYDSIDFLKILGGDSVTFQKIKLNYNSFRFYGFASEPATNCVLISVILLPFLFSELKMNKKNKKYTVFLLVTLAITLIFAYLTKSASVYIGIIVLLFYTLFLFMRNKKIHLIIKLSVVFALISIFIIIFFVPSIKTLFTDKFVLKIFDKNNYSTQHRYSTVWNDIKIFAFYPIFGVGDGNQGYFYARNVIGTWMSNNSETQRAITGELGLLNGGAAVPSIISGFGIVGIIVLLYFGKKYFEYWQKRNKKFCKYKNMYIVGGVTFFVLCVATQGMHRNYLLLLYISAIALGANKSSNIANIKSILCSKDTFIEQTNRRVRFSYCKIDI